MDLKSKLLSFRGRLRREPVVAAPELTGFDAAGLFVRELTAAERDAYESSRNKLRRFGDPHGLEPDLNNIRARLLVLCLCDAEGRRVFEDGEALQLGELPAIVLDRWFEQAALLSGLSKREQEMTRKNSNGRAPAAASPSDLL